MFARGRHARFGVTASGEALGVLTKAQMSVCGG
jgi:hypothetical protein